MMVITLGPGPKAVVHVFGEELDKHRSDLVLIGCPTM